MYILIYLYTYNEYDLGIKNFDYYLLTLKKLNSAMLQYNILFTSNAILSNFVTLKKNLLLIM